MAELQVRKSRRIEIAAIRKSRRIRQKKQEKESGKINRAGNRDSIRPAGTSLGPRKRRHKAVRKESWTYIGNSELERNEKQTAKQGDIVEADCIIFDKKQRSCDTRFIFSHLEGGLVVGHVQTEDGLMELKKTAGHISVCHAEQLAPNSGNLGSRKRRRRQTPKAAAAAKAAAKGPAKTKTKAAAKGPAKTKTKVAAAKGPAKTKAKAAAKGPVKTKTKVAAKGPAKTKAKAAVKGPAKTKGKAAEKGPAKTEAKAAEKGPAETKTKAAAKVPAETKTKVVVKGQINGVPVLDPAALDAFLFEDTPEGFDVTLKGQPVPDDDGTDKMQSAALDGNTTTDNSESEENLPVPAGSPPIPADVKKYWDERTINSDDNHDPSDDNADDKSEPPPSDDNADGKSEPPPSDDNSDDNVDENPPQNNTDGVPKPPDPYKTYLELATVKKSIWIHCDAVISMMQDYCSDLAAESWTIKRLYVRLIAKFSVPFRLNDNAKALGRALDWFRAKPSILANSGVLPSGGRRARWTACKDLARLLMIMLGEERGRAAYVQSNQFPSRARLDDTKLKSLKVEYWLKIADTYNNSDVVVDIDVGNDVVTLYLKAHLRSAYRVFWPAAKLRESFMKLRREYEGSQAKDNYDRSGQNSDLFYPDFQSNNPAHVMLHYLLRKVPRGAVLGDLPENATLDTGVDGTDNTHAITVSDNSPSSEGDNEAEPPKEQTQEEEPPRLRRPVRQRLMDSPASSIASSASAGRGRSRSRSRGRGRGSYGSRDESMGNVQRTLKRACDQILYSFDSMAKRNRRQERHAREVPSRHDDVITRGNRAMELIKTKKQLTEQIEQLQDMAADADDIQLLRINLQSVKDEIKKLLSA